MATVNSINLIRTKTSASPQFGAIEVSLRKSGYVGLVIFLCLGVIIGVVYAYLSQEKGRLEASRVTLLQRAATDSQKEAIYIAIKSRVLIVGKALQNQKPWDQLLDRVNTYVSPPTLTNISVDNQNRISLSLQTDSVDTILPVVNSIIAEAKNKRLINPQLESFTIAPTGNISAKFTFFTVFN